MARPIPRLAVVAGIATGLLAGGLTTAIAIGNGTIDPPPRIAFVARSDNPADALAVGPVAGQLGAPLFVTAPDSLVPATEAGLKAYAPKVVIITGGTGAVSAGVEAAIEAALGLPDEKVVRAQGKDRHETAVAITDLLAAYNPAYLPVDAKALTAAFADKASKAEVGLSPVAYATVLSDGTVVTERSRGVTDANVALEGISGFCFYDLPFDFTTAQATPLYEGPEETVSAQIGLPDIGLAGDVVDCSDDNPQLEVATLVESTWEPAAFVVWFYN